MGEVCAREEGLQFVKKQINTLNHKQGSSIINGMKRFWFGLAIAIFFYTKMDILIWQRIFEEHKLIGLGIGMYHWGWFQSLLGFMTLGILICYPNRRRMITFPFSLGILAFSGLEDILYYWLDGKNIPAELPWLSSNPLLLKPVTFDHLLISAGFWLLFVIGLDLFGGLLTKAALNTIHKSRYSQAFSFFKSKEMVTRSHASQSS
jgi:hypothetical protein